MTMNLVYIWCLINLLFPFIFAGGNDDQTYRNYERRRKCPKCMNCTLQVKGYDITGSTNGQIFGQHPGLKNACDCAKLCLTKNSTCTSYVWKYNGSPTPHKRVCILYSNFQLPSDVTLGFDLETTECAGTIQNNPQQGSSVPHCLGISQDSNSWDRDCISGSVFITNDGGWIC